MAAKYVKTEVEKHLNKNQVEQLVAIRDKYAVFEKHLTYLKRILKESDNTKFDAVKKEVFAWTLDYIIRL